MFKIINFINKLELIEEKNTEYTFVCPVCGGNKLKVNKNSNAYACYDNFCSPNDIRNKIGYVSNHHDKWRTKTPVNIIEPVNFDFINLNYIKCSIKEVAPIKRGAKYYTNYYYNDKSCIERVDYIKENKKVKDCYPKHKINGVWIYGSSNEFGFYQQEYLKEKGTLIVVEGEKTANIFSSHFNILAVTPPAFGWNNDYICRWLFFNSDKIEQILYLPDNDNVGFTKANIFKLSSWKRKIPCHILKLNEIFEMKDREDVVDLIERNENVIDVLENVKRYA